MLPSPLSKLGSKQLRLDVDIDLRTISHTYRVMLKVAAAGSRKLLYFFSSSGQSWKELFIPIFLILRVLVHWIFGTRVSEKSPVPEPPPPKKSRLVELTAMIYIDCDKKAA